MTRDEFIGRFLDEENAALLRAHAEAVEMAGARLSDEHHVRLGRATVAQLRRCRDRLGRMYDALHPAAAEGADAKPTGGATIPMTNQRRA